MATARQTLSPAISPPLPTATVEYSQQYVDQYNAILRLYFTQLDNLTSALLEPNGARFLSAPYAAFQHNASITAAAANTAYSIPFNTFDFGSAVSIVDTTKITVEYAGAYNLQFSGQLQNTNASTIAEVSIWLAKNGTNVSETNTVITVPTKHGSVSGYAVAAWNLPVVLAAGDYIELKWSTTSTDVSLPYIGTQTSPTRPETPAVIGTLTYLSRP